MSFPRPRKTESEEELYQYAVGALGRRMRSTAELKRLLRRRVEAEKWRFVQAFPLSYWVALLGKS